MDRRDTTGYKELYYETTTICPDCETLIPGKVMGFHDGVYVTRTCPEHGHFRGLVCSDVTWYEGLKRFDVAPVKPTYVTGARDKGCPSDCGICPSHRQKAGTAAIEISNRCNLSCPSCLANNQGTFELSAREVMDSADALIEAQGGVDLLVLSGGEPTVHPELFEMMDGLADKKIGRLVVNSNGKRIADDDMFLDELSKRNVYVCMHYDGERSMQIRGSEHSMQKRALARLIERGIKCTPLVLGAKDHNDEALGSICLELLRRSESINSIIVSLMAYTGSAKQMMPEGGFRRLTIPEALEKIERSSGGIIGKASFIPLPMPNPLCVAIGYFLVDEERVVPLIPIAGVDRVVEFLSNSHFGEPDMAFESFFRQILDEVYSSPEKYDDAEGILRSFRRLLDRLYPSGGTPPTERERRDMAEGSIKSVYVMQFMDAWTFDSVRMTKCSCQHLLPGGKVVPSCGYYTYHRRFDRRFEA